MGDTALEGHLAPLSTSKVKPEQSSSLGDRGQQRHIFPDVVYEQVIYACYIYIYI